MLGISQQQIINILNVIDFIFIILEVNVIFLHNITLTERAYFTTKRRKLLYKYTIPTTTTHRLKKIT